MTVKRDVSPPKEDFFCRVMREAKVEICQPKGVTTKMASLDDRREGIGNNIENINKVADAVAELQEGNAPSASSQQELVMSGNGGQNQKTAIDITPQAGGKTAPTNFSVGTSAVKGSSLESGYYTLKNSAATFDKTGEMITYTPHCEDVTYNVGTGQKQNSANPAAGTVDERIERAVADVAAEYTPEEMIASIKKAGEEQMSDLAWTKRKMEELYLEKPDMIAELKKEMGIDTPNPAAKVAAATPVAAPKVNSFSFA